MTHIPDDLSIPAFLRATGPGTPCVQHPVQNDGHIRRNLDAETQKFLEQEQERERIEKANALAAHIAKQAMKIKVLLNGRYDSRLNRWITPEEDFARMAETAKVAIEVLREHFEIVARHPDYPADGVKAFAKRTLSQIDNGKLAVEGEKMMARTRRRLRRRAMANACAAKPARRRSR